MILTIYSDSEADLADQPTLETIAMLGAAGLDLAELRAWWRMTGGIAS